VSALITEAVEVAVDELVPLVGTKDACLAVGLPRASYYRARPATQPAQAEQQPPHVACETSTQPPSAPSSAPASLPLRQRRRQVQPRALTGEERATVLEVLHSERFADAAPATVYATLLDEGVYLCSEATMYRLLRERGETGDRRRHATHPAKVKPELVADGPNRVWSCYAEVVVMPTLRLDPRSDEVSRIRRSA